MVRSASKSSGLQALLALGCLGCLVIAQHSSQSTHCRGEHECWYNRPRVVATITYVRPWWCPFSVCRRPVTKYYEITQKECDCCPGWVMNRGDQCAPCESGRFGINCQRECQCSGDGVDCDRATGQCLSNNCNDGEPTGQASSCLISSCASNCTKGRVCDYETGNCMCPAHWDDDCQFYLRVCDHGFYGQDCNQSCPCDNQATCEQQTGRCECPAGWTGDRCARSCPTSRYGPNCTSTCQCPPASLGCSPADGDCYCPDGFYGLNCTTACPDGLYGRNCQQNCNCDLSTQSCDPRNGMCTDKFRPQQQSSNLATSLSVVFVILFALLVTVAFFVHRRKRASKKSEEQLAGSSVEFHLDTPTFEGHEGKGIPEYAEVQQRDGNGYESVLATNPQGTLPTQQVNLTNTTFGPTPALSQPPAADEGDPRTDDYSHLDRHAVAGAGVTNGDRSDVYAVCSPTSVEEAGQYSHLDRALKRASLRIDEGASNEYGTPSPVGPRELDGEYSQLSHV